MAAVAKVAEEKKAAPGRTVRVAGIADRTRFGQRPSVRGTPDTFAGTTKKNFSPGQHGLFDTVGLAYNTHVGVSLRPDDFRLAILQGLTTAVGLAPNIYRAALGIQHKGKETLTVQNNNMTMGPGAVHETETKHWAESLPEFKDKIMARVTGTLVPTLMKPFSTTTPLDEVVSAVTLMSICKDYFDYYMSTFCGIPSIHFAGVKADWELLLEIVNSLTALGLDWWVAPMKHAVGRIVALFADGQPEVLDVKAAPTSYWHNIYNRMDEGSGRPDTCNGWIYSFLPYTDPQGTRSDFSTKAADLDAGDVLKTRQSFDKMPAGHREVDATWLYGKDNKVPIVVSAGFAAAAMDRTGTVLSPVVGWCVYKKRMRNLEEIRASFDTEEFWG